MALETSPEHPAPVRTVSRLIGEYVNRLGRIWVEGQVAQLTRRPGSSTAFLTLRDPVADLSLSVTCSGAVLDSVSPPLTDGARIVVWAKPELYLRRGSLSLVAHEIRPVGVGELLARIERLRALLAAEGLFAPERKRPLPFVPDTVGLVCGRGSAAERDVVDNSRRRWPAVRFRIEAAAVQGPYAVSELVEALRRLDRDPAVAVIVVARGGGSVEDLLPFSDEGLLRAVAACRTPVVSAIGHQQDTPLLDHVADARASTPTDAARLVVPDLAAELAGIAALTRRAGAAVEQRLARAEQQLATLRAHPVLARPGVLVDRREEEIAGLARRTATALRHRLERAGDDLVHASARLHAVSPAATLDRGYAIVVSDDGRIVREPEAVEVGAAVDVRLAGGTLRAQRLPSTP